MTNTYILSGIGSDFTISHNSIILEPIKKYEAAFLSLEVYNSFPNITKGKNNIFKYSNDNGTSWKVLELDTGSYEVETLSDEIQRLMVINAGYNESTNIVDIMTINSILVNVDIIAGSYVNGTPLPVIYSFYPNVSPGYKIVERPSPQLIYYPISRNDISIMRIWLSNQDNKPVDLRGETLTVRIVVKEVVDLP